LICVPIAQKLGIGSVLGYILGGVLIGPSVLGLVGKEGEDVMHTTEFGVVMMLFIIGLELSPQAFWRMKNRILGLGGLQILFTAIALFPAFYFLGKCSLNASIGLSLSFAMSSTAIVFQTLKEKSLEKTEAGKSSFAVLLFQDIAVIPILAILPFLAGKTGELKEISANPILAFFQTYESLTIALAVAFIVILGKYLINPILYFVGKTKLKELFTASALLIIVGVSWLMNLVGVSAALGAFMAGVLLANSEFRHQLESDVEPFKGLLMGIFFTAVGSTINFEVITSQTSEILIALLILILIKALIIFSIGKFSGMSFSQNSLFALLLCQAGEFVFVLLGSLNQLGLNNRSETDFYMALVTLSMIFSPILLFIYEKVANYWLKREEKPENKYDEDIHGENQIIIAGFSHFGSTLGRFLRANGVKATILDSDSDRVSFLRKMGFNVYYGDASRLELLESAGAGKAKILISAIDNPEKTMEIAQLCKSHFPNLKLFLRANNRFDAYNLLENEFQNIYRESLHSSVYMGVDVLTELGYRKYTTKRKADDFIKYDSQALLRLVNSKNDLNQYIFRVKEEIAEQERLLNEDSKFIDNQIDNSWDNNFLK
jgi:CPA2 family monovalent cation:H+ antiporter-2